MTTFSISIGRRCAIANKLAQSSSDLASAKATQTVYSILVDSYSATQKENYQMFKDETGKWRTTPFKENVSTTFNATDEQILEFRSVIEWLSSRLAIDREDTALFAQITAAASNIDDTKRSQRRHSAHQRNRNGGTHRRMRSQNLGGENRVRLPNRRSEGYHHVCRVQGSDRR